MPKVMATPFIKVVEPDRGNIETSTSRIRNYNVDVPHHQQDSRVPSGFLDAMEVRTEVFVKEQGVPAKNEFDGDDPRCVHIVAYSSIQTTLQHEIRDKDDNVVAPKKSETKAVPIGTIRIVPFPAGPHPEAGAQYWAGLKIGADGKPEPLPDHGDLGFEYEDRATSLHDGKEHYVKFGRLAVLKTHRRLGIASLLVSAAEDWLVAHPTYWNRSALEWGLQKLGSKHRELPEWNGLIGIHAQKSVSNSWSRWGFVMDQGMGTWWEEGIEHAGMFKRLRLSSRSLGIDPTLKQMIDHGTTSFVHGRKRYPVQPHYSERYPFSIQGAIDEEEAYKEKIANEGRDGQQKFKRRPLPDPMSKANPEWCQPSGRPISEQVRPARKEAGVITEGEGRMMKGLQEWSLVGGRDDGSSIGKGADCTPTDSTFSAKPTPSGSEGDSDEGLEIGCRNRTHRKQKGD